MGGCSFAEFPQDAKVQTSLCRSWVERTVREIRTRHPDVVLIHQCARVHVGCLPSGVDWIPTWKSGLASVLTSISDSVDQVVIVEDVPRFEKDIGTCLFLFRRAPNCGQQPTADVRARASPVGAASRQAVDGLQGVMIVDPVPIVCQPVVCRQVISGKVMYWDADHLSAQGADRLTPMLTDAIARALAAP